MYYNVLELDYRFIGVSDELWWKFVRKIKKEYKKIESQKNGVLTVKYKNNKMNDRDFKIYISNSLSEFLDENIPLVRKENVSKEKKVLPIEIDTESNTYLFYSTRLAIIQTESQLKEWLYKSFINIKAYINEMNYNFFFFEEKLEDMLEFTRLTYQDVGVSTDILDFIKENILQGKYINIHLDEFYLSQKDYGDELHYVHESMIYGFDEHKKRLYAYGFTKRQKVTSFYISYDELYLAYEKAKLFLFCGAEYLENDYPWPVVLCKLRNSVDQDYFTVEDFNAEIKNYLYPKENEIVQGDIHIYGKNVYRYIYEQLTKESSEGTVDFRTFQLLYEHKVCVKNRMNYLFEKYEMMSQASKIIEEYDQIVGGFLRIRILYLKQSFKEGKINFFNRVVTDMDIKIAIAEKLEALCKREEEVLEQFRLLL